ncbi:uncharacterized protein LOC144090479 isoform X3 [Stigmatopora argus]
MSRDPRFPMSTPSGLIRLSPHCQGPRAITSFSLRLPFLKKTQSPLQAGGQHPGTWKQVSCFWRPRNTRQQSLYNEGKTIANRDSNHTCPPSQWSWRNTLVDFSTSALQNCLNQEVDVTRVAYVINIYRELIMDASQHEQGCWPPASC